MGTGRALEAAITPATRSSLATCESVHWEVSPVALQLPSLVFEIRRMLTMRPNIGGRTRPAFWRLSEPGSTGLREVRSCYGRSAGLRGGGLPFGQTAAGCASGRADASVSE